MQLVAGLGNPGQQYEGSRHNLGFEVVERLAAICGASGWRQQNEALVLKTRLGEQQVLLAKPQTFMNDSGRSVAALLKYYKIALADCLVVLDDLDLPPGMIRMRGAGSDGGHKGLRSIIDCVGSREIKRLRIGIGRPPGKAGVTSYVLGRSRDQAQELGDAVEEAARLAARYIESGQFDNWSSL